MVAEVSPRAAGGAAPTEGRRWSSDLPRLAALVVDPWAEFATSARPLAVRHRKAA